MAETVVEVRDEKGNGFDLIQFEDVLLPKFFTDWFEGITLEEKLEKVKSVPYQDGDVLICSYPKTGTHWMTNLVSMLYVGTENVVEASSVAPILIDLFPEETYTILPGPRILNTHLKVDRFPKELKARAKLVFVIRNPKDACVSLFHHMQRSTQVSNKQTWASMVEHFLHGPAACGTYADYLNDLQKSLETDTEFKPHIAYFEDLKKDGVGELRRLQAYLGLDHPDSHLTAVLARCSVDKLRQDVDDGKIKTVLVNEEGKSVLYRKGEIGDWKNHFTVAQNEAFDQYWSEKMADSLFKFKYE